MSTRGSDRVRFDKALVESVIGLAPKSFTLHARNAARSVAHRRQCRRLLLGRERAECRRSRRRKASRARSRITATSSGSANRSIPCMSGADIPWSPPIFMPPCVISMRCSTCSPCRTSRSTPTASARDASATASRWRASRAASIADSARARALALHHHQLFLALAPRQSDARGHHPDGARATRWWCSRPSRSPAPWRR